MTDTPSLFKPTELRGRALAGYLADLLEANPHAHKQVSFIDPKRDGKTDDQVYAHGLVDLAYAEDTVREDSCGTTACVAGWTALVTGHSLTGSFVRTADGHGAWIDGVAADLLGLTDEQKDAIFYELRDESRALRRLRAYANGVDDLREVN